MTEYKILGIIINNNLIEEIPKFCYGFKNPECKELLDIIEIVQKKYQSVTKDLLEQYISENKKHFLEKYYYIIDIANDIDSLKGLVREVETRNARQLFDAKNNYIRTNPQLSHLEIKEEAQKIIDSVNDVDEKEIEDSKDVCLKILEYINSGEKKKKTYSGISYFDINQNGYNAEWIVITGEPGAGKTGKIIDTIPKQLKKGIRVGMETLEVTREMMYQLLACNMAGVNTLNYENNNFSNVEKTNLIRALEKLYEWPLYIGYGTYNWVNLESRIKIMKQEKDIDIMYIDYIGQVEMEGMNEYELITHLAKRIKKLNNDLLIPIVTVAEMNKEGEKSTVPSLNNLKGNKKLQYASDIVLFAKRVQDQGDESSRVIDWYVKKNKYGKCGKFREIFQTPFRRFKDFRQNYENLNQNRKDIYD